MRLCGKALVTILHSLLWLAAIAVLLWGGMFCVLGLGAISGMDKDEDNLAAIEARVCTALLQSMTDGAPDELAAVRSAQERANSLREEADRIWRTIPEGATIYRVLGGQERAVGDNYRVVQNRKDANAIERDVLPPLRHEAAQRHAHRLSGKSREALYHQYRQASTSVGAWKARHSWYYTSPAVRILLRILGVVALLSCLVVIALAVESLNRRVSSIRKDLSTAFAPVNIIRKDAPRAKAQCQRVGVLCLTMGIPIVLVGLLGFRNGERLGPSVALVFGCAFLALGMASIRKRT